MSAPFPEGDCVDESRIDTELEHQLRRRNVAHAAAESGIPGAGSSGPAAAGDLGGLGEASAASTTAHAQLPTFAEPEPTPTPTTPMPVDAPPDDPLPAAVPEAVVEEQRTAEIAVESPPAASTEGATEPVPPAPTQTADTADAEAEGKERACRICFGGVDEEGEMGRLISPCLCSGSMRDVHRACLGMWRAKNSKTFLECPQCKYAYRLRRGRVGDLMLAPRVLALTALITFLVVALTAGHFLLHFLLNLYQKGNHSSSAVGSTWESEDGTMVVYMSGATFILDLIDDSINTFIAITGAAFDIFEGSRWVTPLMLDVILRFLLGVSLLGSLSALSLLGSLRLLAPLQLLYTISLSGVVDLTPALGLLGGSRAVIVAFVLVGVANSTVQVYDALHAAALFALRFVESEIMEPRRDQLGATDERPRTWGSVWVRERKWRSIDGWIEVYTRTRERVKRARPQNDPGREVLVQMAAEARPQGVLPAAEQPPPAAVPAPAEPVPVRPAAFVGDW